MPIIEQDSPQGGRRITHPRPHNASLHVDQKGLRGFDGCEKGISLECFGLVDPEAELDRGLPGRFALTRDRFGVLFRSFRFDEGRNAPQHQEGQTQSNRDSNDCGETDRQATAHYHAIQPRIVRRSRRSRAWYALAMLEATLPRFPSPFRRGSWLLHLDGQLISARLDLHLDARGFKTCVAEINQGDVAARIVLTSSLGGRTHQDLIAALQGAVALFFGAQLKSPIRTDVAACPDMTARIQRRKHDHAPRQRGAIFEDDFTDDRILSLRAAAQDNQDQGDEYNAPA